MRALNSQPRIIRARYNDALEGPIAPNAFEEPPPPPGGRSYIVVDDAPR